MKVPVARITEPFALLGRIVIERMNSLGSVAAFLTQALLRIAHSKQFARTVQQVYYIGAKSSVIILLIGFFTGMVLGLHFYHALSFVGAEGSLGALVALSLIRELGPVLTAIMITARAGSAVTAEIGMQRATEQIDALVTMRIDPIGYLVSPRIAAAVISFPLLTAFFDVIGIIGGYISGVIFLGGDSASYLYRVQSSLDMKDITNGIIKAVAFAVIVATVCCYEGYFSHRRADTHGARAVSLATTSAVVTSCVIILIADYVITSFLLRTGQP